MDALDFRVRRDTDEAVSICKPQIFRRPDASNNQASVYQCISVSVYQCISVSVYQDSKGVWLVRYFFTRFSVFQITQYSQTCPTEASHRHQSI